MESSVAKLIRNNENAQRRQAALAELQAKYLSVAPDGYLRTIDFLDAMRASLGLTSDYQLAKALGVSHTRVSNWRTQRNTFDEDTAIRVADIVGMPRGFILACAAAERNTRVDIKRAWADVAKALLGIAAGVLLVQFALLPSWDSALTAQAFFAFAAVPDLHIMRICVILAVTCFLAAILAIGRSRGPSRRSAMPQTAF